MNKTQSRQYEMLQRVHTFGETRRDLFPVESLGGRAFEAVGAAVNELARHAASKMSAARGGRLAKATTRAELLGRLTDIVRSARVISRSEPEFGDPFHLPVPRSDQALVTTGRVFVTAGETVKSRFIEYGMPEDFVTSLRAVVDEFEQALKTREAGKDGTTLARASIEAALDSGLEAVRTLDVIVANRLRTDTATLQVWERDRRVEPGRRAKSVAAQVPADPNAVAPAAMPAPMPAAATPDVAAPERAATVTKVA